jgi:hypothetical protein
MTQMGDLSWIAARRTFDGNAPIPVVRGPPIEPHGSIPKATLTIQF